MNVSPANSGEVLVNGVSAASYPHTFSEIATGSLVRLTINPAAGYVFSYWDGAYSGLATSVDINLTCDMAIVAYFVPGVGVILGSAFADADGDGIYDPAEAGVAGISVKAYKPNGDLAGSAITNSLGAYRIAVAEPGAYSVNFASPYGAQFSAAWYGLDQALDSDADPSSGDTRQAVIDAVSTTAQFDAGYTTLPSTRTDSDSDFEASSSSGGGGGCFINTILGFFR